MKKYKSSVRKLFLFFSILPILIFAIIVTIISTKNMYTIKEKDAQKFLRSSALGLIETYQHICQDKGDIYEKDGNYYIGDMLLNDNNDIVDMKKQYANADYSLFYGDERIITTIKDKDGKRITNTKSEKIWADYVSKGEEYFSNKIVINGVKFYGYYVPLLDSNKNVIGMGFAGSPREDILKTLKRLSNMNLYIVLGICFVVVAIAIIISHRYIVTQNKLLKYMSEIDEGKYEHTLDSGLLNRKDEYARMGNIMVKLNNSLVSLILKDSLTDLYNRRAAMKKLDKFVAEGNSVDADCFTLTICDIDHFKRVNDTYGHNCGDEVLKTVAKCLKTLNNEKDFAARWGGEEFIIVQKGRLKTNVAKLEKLAKDIKEKVVEYDGNKISVTLTFGVSEYLPPEKLDKLISRADRLLYKGKENGRDQIVS